MRKLFLSFPNLCVGGRAKPPPDPCPEAHGHEEAEADADGFRNVVDRLKDGDARHQRLGEAGEQIQILPQVQGSGKYVFHEIRKACEE